MPRKSQPRRHPPRQKKKQNKYDKKITTVAKARVPRANPYPFGRSYFVTLKCSAKVSIAPALHYQSVIIQMNSVNDPLGALANVTYLGHNTLSDIYLDYKCYNFKIAANWIPSVAVPTTFALIPGNDSATLTYSSNIQASSAPGAVSKIVLGSTSNNRVQKMNKSYSIRKVIGCTKGQYQDDSLYSANINSSPTESGWLSVSLMTLDETTNITGDLLLEFEVDVLYFNSRNISQGTSET